MEELKGSNDIKKVIYKTATKNKYTCSSRTKESYRSYKKYIYMLKQNQSIIDI